MDALEFLKERTRMCNYYGNCGDCSLEESRCDISHTLTDEDCERIVAAVEQWSKEHPRKTRQSIFLEQYPEARLDSIGVLCVSFNSVYGTQRRRWRMLRPVKGMRRLPSRVLDAGGRVMEQLTQRLRTGEVLMASEYEEKYTEQEWISVLQDRLASYEDTGLTPEEVTALQKDWSDLCTIIGECGGVDRVKELGRAERGLSST